MLNEKIITIDYDKLDKAIKECQDPVVIMVNGTTAAALISDGEKNPNISVEEQGFEELVIYKGIPITISPILPFGFFIVK